VAMLGKAHAVETCWLRQGIDPVGSEARRMMKKFAIVISLALMVAMLLVGVALAAAPGQAATDPAQQYEDPEGCMSCHDGIEGIVEPDTDMYKQIMARGQCSACHGGDTEVTGAIDDVEAATAAHGPEGKFYPDPGSPWIVNKTCGQCHVDYGYALQRSLMHTEAGKIQGNLWAWGVQGDQTVRYGNYDIDDPDGSEPLFGSDTYKAYMKAMVDKFPDQFPSSLEQLPNPTVEEIVADPSLAAFTYQRNQCQRCHTGVPGRERRGDYRGMGCSSCHIPYGNEGIYEGSDPTVSKDEPGHMLKHSIQGTREKNNGIPVETCNTCHNRGKRIGVSFEGIMEFPYGTPFDENGGKQPKLHTKQYLYIKDDLHHDPISRDGNPPGGMLCQDCHTSIEMHGDGNIFGTTLAQVEIECTDCHGVPDSYPWELPLGYGEEAFLDQISDEGRGTTYQLPTNLTYGTVYDVEDGYMLTARGNPFGNVVRRGDDVIVHSASGRDFTVPTLKSIKDAGTWKSLDAQVAMDAVDAHQEKLECYTCHADWAPQCYGCHVTADYSGGAQSTDWVASGNTQNPDGTVDTSLLLDGTISEGRGYLRWESPILGVNGEGRVTPIIPGCQVVYTVIGPDGESLAHNEIGRTPPNTEGGGEEGQLGMDMAPAQPHTTGRRARRCESCHANPKALGYGVDEGVYLLGYEEDKVIDLRDAYGNLIPSNTSVQMPAISDLPMDWAQVVNPETGEQMMTVGSHWPGSGPLSEEQRTRMTRTGACLGCHQNMADPSFWTDQVVAQYGVIMTNDDHIEHMNELLHEATEGRVAMAEAGGVGSDEALAQIQSLEGQLADSQAALGEADGEVSALSTQIEATAESDDETAPKLLLYAGIAAILGLVIGAFAMRTLKK